MSIAFINSTEHKTEIKKPLDYINFLGFIGGAELFTYSPETCIDKGDFTGYSGIMPTWRDFRPH
jgi:hypothetical protein